MEESALSKWDLISKDEYLFHEVDQEEVQAVIRRLSHRKLENDELFGKILEENDRKLKEEGLTSVISSYESLLDIVLQLLSKSNHLETSNNFFPRFLENLIANLCTCYLEKRNWERIVELVDIYRRHSDKIDVNEESSEGVVISDIKLRIVSFRLIAYIKQSDYDHIREDISIFKEMLILKRKRETDVDLSEYYEIVIEGQNRLLNYDYQKELQDDFGINQWAQVKNQLETTASNTNERDLNVCKVLESCLKHLKDDSLLYRLANTIIQMYIKYK